MVQGKEKMIFQNTFIYLQTLYEHPAVAAAYLGQNNMLELAHFPGMKNPYLHHHHEIAFTEFNYAFTHNIYLYPPEPMLSSIALSFEFCFCPICRKGIVHALLSKDHLTDKFQRFICMWESALQKELK